MCQSIVIVIITAVLIAIFIDIIITIEIKYLFFEANFFLFYNRFDYWAVPNSPDLHPIGYCRQASITLQKPHNFPGEFDWSSYLSTQGAIAAPSHLLGLSAVLPAQVACILLNFWDVYMNSLSIVNLSRRVSMTQACLLSVSGCVLKLLIV